MIMGKIDSMNKPIITSLFALMCLIANLGKADILPPGHKNIDHQLVFESSPLFDEYCLVAAPIRGFSGFHIVVPGQPFHFSSKYGTRLYLIPKSVAADLKFDREQFDQWPSTLPPVSQIASVFKGSPIDSAVTTARFVGLRDGKPEIVVVEHKELDAAGKPISYWRAYGWLAIPLIGGFMLIARFVRRIRSRKANFGQTKIV
jgi:hypothetical protein